MAIVAAFSGIPLFGIPASFQVQFADESTGSPDSWLWNFGDGMFSEEQHPLHTYTGEFGDKFTVSLKAYIISGPEIFRNTVQKFEIKQRTADTFDNTVEVFSNLGSKSFQTFSSSGALKSWHFFDGTGLDEENPTYNGQDIQAKGTISIPAPAGGGPSVFITKSTLTQVSSSLREGTITSTLGGRYDAAGPISNQFMSDVTGKNGSTVELIPNYVFITITPPQAPFEQSGIGANLQVYERRTSSEDNFDQTTKTDYIIFGTPPIAAFNASPTSGPNPLTVQFENQSTPAVGLPTTYLWKKRKTGSGDAFVEFSTQEHPTEIFTK
jgi:PKD repeat protein